MAGRIWGLLRDWPYTFAVIVSASIGIAAIIASDALDVSLRDPDGFLGPAYVRLPLIGLAFFAVGIVPMAIKRRGVRHMVSGMREIFRNEWSWSRVLHIATGLITFYVSYVSYRNLKNFIPSIREDVSFDAMLTRWDYAMLFGNHPAEVLHSLLGTGFTAQILATVYISYLMLIPITLGAFLVLNRDFSLGAWYATALSLNWILGTISYYILPSVGPAFYNPQLFADLPVTGVSQLQDSLFKNAAAHLDDPVSSLWGLAGFASLHVSVTLTACLFFQRTDQARIIQVIAWVYFVLTVFATIYFGWHYIADDFAGALIGWMSVAIAGWATGNGFWHQKHHHVQLTADPEAGSSADTVSSPN